MSNKSSRDEGMWDVYRQCEDEHWWFISVREFIKNYELERLAPGGALVLDLGCGTGGVSRFLRRRGFERVLGADLSKRALVIAAQDGSASFVQADAEQLPFGDATVSLIVSIDMIGASSLDSNRLLSEVRRVLVPGGHALIQGAAFQFLLSSLDRLVGNAQRFNRSQFAELMQANALTPIRVRYHFFLLFPLMAAWKLISRLRSAVGLAPEKLSIQTPPAFINGILRMLCRAEARLLRKISPPFGTSVCALVRR